VKKKDSASNSTAKAEPVVLWSDDQKMTSNPEILVEHIKWLEKRGVVPAVIHKELDGNP
jgi:hypothetical protein